MTNPELWAETSLESSNIEELFAPVLFEDSTQVLDSTIVVENSSAVSYKVDSIIIANAQVNFKQFNQFFTRLEQSGRNYMVVMVPEHGASLAGDKMQIAGMRDIPSPAILDIPVGVKFIGPNAKPNSAQKVISEPSSYLAISELIARATRQNIFSGTLDLGMLAADLPKTPMVGENSGTRMQMFNGKPYIQLDDGEWMVYPGY